MTREEYLQDSLKISFDNKSDAVSFLKHCKANKIANRLGKKVKSDNKKYVVTLTNTDVEKLLGESKGR